MVVGLWKTPASNWRAQAGIFPWALYYDGSVFNGEERTLMVADRRGNVVSEASLNSSWLQSLSRLSTLVCRLTSMMTCMTINLLECSCLPPHTCLLQQPRVPISVVFRAFTVAAPAVWNSLSVNTQSADVFVNFKTKTQFWTVCIYLRHLRRFSAITALKFVFYATYKSNDHLHSPQW